MKLTVHYAYRENIYSSSSSLSSSSYLPPSPPPPRPLVPARLCTPLPPPISLLPPAGVVKHFRHVAASLPLLSQPLGGLPIGTWAPDSGRAGPTRPLLLLQPSTPLITALSLLLQGEGRRGGMGPPS